MRDRDTLDPVDRGAATTDPNTIREVQGNHQAEFLEASSKTSFVGAAIPDGEVWRVKGESFIEAVWAELIDTVNTSLG
jgi:hypothetical protein